VCLVLNCISLRVHVRAPRYNSCIHFYKRPRPIAWRTGARNVQLSEPSRFCDPCRIHTVSLFAFSLHLALPRRKDESISSRAVSSSCRNCGSDSPRARPNAAICMSLGVLVLLGGMNTNLNEHITAMSLHRTHVHAKSGPYVTPRRHASVGSPCHAFIDAPR